MVAGEAAGGAVRLAREHPDLAVGLHLVVLDGQAVLPPSRIPHLVDGQGRLPAQPVRLGLRYVSSRTARRELALEIEAQFERFAATGLRLSHVDGHWHMHVHPTVFDLLLPLAERYGAGGIRLPREPLLPALRYDRSRAGTKLAWALAYALLCRRCEARLRGRGIRAADRVYGLMQTGRMQEAYVAGVLRRLEVRSAELYFHPSMDEGSEPLGPNPGDLATLLSPAVRQAVRERGLVRATYPTLPRR